MYEEMANHEMDGEGSAKRYFAADESRVAELSWSAQRADCQAPGSPVFHRSSKRLSAGCIRV